MDDAERAAKMVEKQIKNALKTSKPVVESSAPQELVRGEGDKVTVSLSAKPTQMSATTVVI